MLEIRNLEKSFGKKQVLFGIDLTAKKRVYLRFDREERIREDHHLP